MLLVASFITLLARANAKNPVPCRLPPNSANDVDESQLLCPSHSNKFELLFARITELEHDPNPRQSTVSLPVASIVVLNSSNDVSNANEHVVICAQKCKTTAMSNIMITKALHYLMLTSEFEFL